jgi:chloride channel protein, CIC family
MDGVRASSFCEYKARHAARAVARCAIGAGIASVLGRHFGLSKANVRALIPVGCSAALATAFNTPIAAVLFSLEEILGDLHAPVLGSVVLSWATAWILLHLILGDQPLFHVPASGS